MTERGNPLLKGDLDLHGFTEEIVVDIVRQKRWTDKNGAERISYEAKAVLDRQKFGLRWNQDIDVGGVVVGDEVRILVRVEAARVNATP